MGYLGFAEEVFFCLRFKGIVKSSIENVYFRFENNKYRKSNINW